MHTVLLVDDNPRIRACLAGVLRVFGFGVLIAEDGAAGLRAFKRRQPDVVVSGVEMNGLDGFGLLGHVRSGLAGASTPVILLTDAMDPDSRQLAADLGANELLTKPVAPWELVEAIRRQLPGGAAHAQVVGHVDGRSAVAVGGSMLPR